MSNVCSDNGDWKPPPRPAIADFAAPAELAPVQPVWVRLDDLRLADLERPRTIGDGLELTGRTRGILHEWRRGSRGEWFGVVTYGVRYADGRPEVVILREQLAPSVALSPRADNEPIG
jgi:hypothetical protein